MTTVKVKAIGELIRVFIDGVRVSLANGSGSRDVRDGEHVISWIVRGTPGSSFSVQITSPNSVAFKKEAKLDDSKLDAGIHFFKF